VVLALESPSEAVKSDLPVYMHFSAQTSSIRVQEFIESKLERRKKNLLSKKGFNFRFFSSSFHELPMVRFYPRFSVEQHSVATI